MRKKKILITVLSIITALCAILSVACNGGKVKEPTPTASGWTYEFMSDIVIPVENIFEGVSEEEMLDGSVTYRFKSPSYVNKDGQTVQDVYESIFPNVYLNIVGEWTVVYIHGKDAVAKTFMVMDTTPPTVEFFATAYDVFLEIENIDEKDDPDFKPKYKKYSLPTPTIDNLQEIDFSSRVDVIKLFVDENDVNYDPENPVIDLTADAVGRYTPTATGKIEYTLKVKDVYGNETVNTLVWNVKDPNWTDNELANGYLADYDDDGYVNSIKSGWVASYWANSEVYEEWFETFEGANGVLKVSARPNSKAMGCFQYNLPKAVTEAELEGKELMLKLYTPNDIDHVLFGCQTYDRVSDMKHTIRLDLVPNQWNYVIVSAGELAYGCWDRGDTEINHFHICYGDSSYKMSDDLVMYIDSVTIAENLPSVEDVEIDENNLLTWESVANATGYEVIEGEKVTVVETNAYQVTDKTAKIGVRAISEDALYISQAIPTPFIDISALGEKDLAIFNTPSYELLAVKNNTESARLAADLKAEYLESYKGVENVLKVTTKNNSVNKDWGVGDITLKLPKACSGTFTIKFLLEKSNATAIRFLQPTSMWGWDNLTDIEVKDSWQTWNVKYTEGCWVAGGVPYDRIDIMFQGGPHGDENVIYFAIVQDGDTVMDLEMQDVTESLGEDELATYDSERYLITTATDSCPSCGGICDHVVDYSIVPSYTDANGNTQNGLLKIDIASCSARSDAGFVLKLLKEHTGTYTIRYLITKGDDGVLPATMIPRKINANNGAMANEDSNAFNLTENVWHTQAKTTSSEGKKAISLYEFGPGAKYTIYIDGIWNGDKVVDLVLADKAAQLDDDELALYDCSEYTLTLDAMYSPYQGSDYLVSAEYLETFSGRDGVIKLNVKADKDGNNAEFVMNLLKAHTGTYTIRYYVEVPEGNTAPTAIQIKKSNEYGVNNITVEGELSLVTGVWHTLTVTSASELKDALYFYAYGSSSNFNLYIDGVWNGSLPAEEDPSAPDIFG